MFQGFHPDVFDARNRISANDGLLTNVEVREFLQSMKKYRDRKRIKCLNKCGKEVEKRGTYCKECGKTMQGKDVRVSDEKQMSFCEKVQNRVLLYATNYATSKDDDIEKTKDFMIDLLEWEESEEIDKHKRIRPHEKVMMANLHPKSKTHLKTVIEKWEDRMNKHQRKSLKKFMLKLFPYSKEEREVVGDKE